MHQPCIKAIIFIHKTIFQYQQELKKQVSSSIKENGSFKTRLTSRTVLSKLILHEQNLTSLTLQMLLESDVSIISKGLKNLKTDFSPSLFS